MIDLNNKLYLSRFMHYYNSVQNWNKKYAAPFNNHGQGNYTCLPSQFEIVKYWRSARLLFKKGANFGYHLSSLSFCFLGFSLNLGPYLCFILSECKLSFFSSSSLFINAFKRIWYFQKKELIIKKTNCLYENGFMPPSWDLIWTQVRSHLGGIILLHVNSFGRVVPHRQDCSFNLDLVCFYKYYLNSVIHLYKI